METRANYVVVGLFTLAVLAGAFGFVYWLARHGDQGRKDAYDVVFTTSVAGLGKGSAVTFNGIRVGEVEKLALDPRNPQLVRARIRVEGGTPVRYDTRARLELQMLTSVSTVALSGGSPDGPPPESRDGNPPVIYAEHSGLQDLVAGAQALLGKVDDAVSRISKLAATNEAAINNTLQNAELLTRNLSKLADDLQPKLSATAENLSRFSGRGLKEIESFVSDGRRTLNSVERVITDLERNPQRFVAGGSRIPEFNPRR